MAGHIWWMLALVLLYATTVGCVRATAQGMDPDFRPQLIEAELFPAQVRPGDLFSFTLKFRNAGERPARGDYWVFVHFEAPAAACTSIVFQADHPADVPTSMWQPGEVVADGPRILQAPSTGPDREYFVHVGLYDVAGTGERLLDTYAAGKLQVSRTAPSAIDLAPPPLSADELTRRREALAGRLAQRTVSTLDGGTWRLDLDCASGAWNLTDRATGVVWASDPARFGLAEVTLRSGDRSVVWQAQGLEALAATPGQLVLRGAPVVDGQPAGVRMVFTVSRMETPPGFRLEYDCDTTGEWIVERVALLHNALWVTEADGGRVYVPERLGIELLAGEGLPGSREWTTYDSLSMAMCGAVKQGSALLVNWEDVNGRLRVTTTWPDHPLVSGRRMCALSLSLSGPRGTCTVHPLGVGGYVQIAQAYRPLARAKGWLRTWAEKRRDYPTVDRIFGATNFKPFVFWRVLPSSRFSDGLEHTYLAFTFDEVAQCAQHWRNDLGIDRAFVVLAGWINGGYDVRHPDILPAAPECGGNDALAAACERIRACGYLVGLHDNYQDMYQDAPSWSEEWINKDAHGRLKMGGNWNGGQAWQVCAIKQVELAARPETNLPRVAQLFAPTIYFIDTVFAWPLVTCEDPQHPMTRADDLAWKTRLCLLAKQHFGLFGSEEGREWAVPCADYLEGIFGHQTASAPGAVIPLFPLVYSDCVQLMTHQGDRIGPGDEKKMADHILFAEMHLPSFGEHLYWTRPETQGLPIIPLSPRVHDLGGRRFEITYRWRVDGPVSEDYTIFVHFTHPATTRPESIAYQNDHLPSRRTSLWEPGSIVEDGPYVVEVPTEFDGPAQVLLGMTHDGRRVALGNLGHEGLRYCVGTITVGPEGITFEPREPTERSLLWTRGDGGWGQDLCTTDRIIKNTWEVLSPLNVITAEVPLTTHEFLSDDRLLQRTRFGDVTITVTYDNPAQIGDTVLPPYGFLIDSPTYLAFCATRHAGLQYSTPTLFTARSLDGQPIAESGRVRVYHGFGDPQVRLGERVFEVQREAVVAVEG